MYIKKVSLPSTWTNVSSTGDGVELLLTWLVGSQGTDRGTSPCVREMMYFLKHSYRNAASG